MNCAQLEHIIRAASEISGDREIVAVGSQSIHAHTVILPPIAFQSNEADVYPRNHPERAAAIDAAIREPGLCLDVHDLALSKYAAGREKDIAFNRELARHGVVGKRKLIRRVASMPLDEAHQHLVIARIKADFAAATRRGGPARKV